MLQHITIPRGPIELAADLHLPDDIDDAAPLRAVVLSTPGSSVKEQIGANYASRLARPGHRGARVRPRPPRPERR